MNKNAVSREGWVGERRGFLRKLSIGAVALAAAPLMGCTIAKNGSVTTLTLNVAKVDAYAKAAENFADTILSLPVVSAALGDKATVIKTLASRIVSAISSFDSAAGGAASVSYDNSSVKAAFASILDDFSQIVSLVKSALSNIESTSATSGALSTATTATNFAETILSLLQALVTVGAPLRASGANAERDALRGLKVPAVMIARALA